MSTLLEMGSSGTLDLVAMPFLTLTAPYGITYG